MRILPPSITLLLVAVALAGCADGAGEPPGGGDPALRDLDLRATEDTGVIRGIVIDASVTPVAGATVTLQGSGASTTTNGNGAFGFSGLEPGSYFLTVEKPGFATVQSSTSVVAGVDEPPVLKVLLERIPGTQPFVEDLFLAGYLTCGAAVFATSVGCTTFGPVADAVGDQSIFSVDYTQAPQWVQGELVWEATQPAAGAFIWEIVRSEEPQTPQPHIGYRETRESPALAYLNGTVTAEHAEWIVEKGLDFRFFGGPHELCRIPAEPPAGSPVGWRFGCGLTLEQEAEVFVHNFYNFSPAEGWRFTVDGAHPLPS